MDEPFSYVNESLEEDRKLTAREEVMSIVHTGQAVGWYRCDGKDCPICGPPIPADATREGGLRLFQMAWDNDPFSIRWDLASEVGRAAKHFWEAALIEKKREAAKKGHWECQNPNHGDSQEGPCEQRWVIDAGAIRAALGKEKS